MTTKTIIDSFSGPNRFLSNFFMTPVVYDGMEYPSSEHAYQAAKAARDSVYSVDPYTDHVVTWRTAIAFAPTAGKAKKMGSPEGTLVDGERRVIPIRPDWNWLRERVMQDILEVKFAPGSEMAEKLIATGDAELVEGNTWGDTFWGVCKGVGENKLGKILMRIREQVAKAKEFPEVADLSEEGYEEVDSAAMMATAYFVDRLRELDVKVNLHSALAHLAEIAPQYIGPGLDPDDPSSET